MGVGKGFDAADSWNVALLFLIYAVLSVGIEHGVHWIKHLVHGKKTLMLVIHKAEEELFLLGTVSFLLLVFEDIIINNSCVKSSIFDGDNWALCHVSKSGYYGSSSNSTGSYSGRRRLQGAVGGGDGICPDGKEPFFSASLLHHVHIFIFLLAISHVLYTAATLTLGRWRLKDMMSRRTEHLRVTVEQFATRCACITGASSVVGHHLCYHAHVLAPTCLKQNLDARGRTVERAFELERHRPSRSLKACNSVWWPSRRPTSNLEDQTWLRQRRSNSAND